ncbi:MAG: hypothetical protein ACXVDJ_10880 [Tumebacillaceae bacterium]
MIFTAVPLKRPACVHCGTDLMLSLPPGGKGHNGYPYRLFDGMHRARAAKHMGC